VHRIRDKALEIILGAVIAALLAACAWYLREQRDELKALREQQVELRIQVEKALTELELARGGKPWATGGGDVRSTLEVPVGP
jgi:hypothetical protein